MSRQRFSGIASIGAIVLSGAIAALAQPSGMFSHEDWETVVERFVDGKGLVDYLGLAEDRSALDLYVAAVEAASPESDPGLFPTRQHELAYYINAYNALVFHGVLTRGPEDDSVWKGGLISGHGFFVSMKIVVGGRKTNLRKLENEIIRKRYGDPRIHAALNCASMGCPRLPRFAFTGDDVDRQLDDAIREFVGDDRHVRVDEDTRTVYLSKIFEWFEDDFRAYENTQGNTRGTVIDYINRHRRPDARVPADFEIEYMPYDKRINKQGQPWEPPS